MRDIAAEVNNLVRFSWVEPLRKDRVVGFPRVRDSEAFNELHTVLVGDGYRYSDTILNYPDRDEQHEPSHIAADGLRANDLIVLATRPPIRERAKDRKKTRTSDTVIENRILEACREYFHTSRRNAIVLSDRVQNEISLSYPVETETMTDVVVYTRPRAIYKAQSGTPIEGTNKSPVYLLRLPSIEWGGRLGPELLVAFGMSAPLSLAWAHILRTRLPRLLSKPRFLMAELTLPRKLNPAPVSLDAFCGDWKVGTIFDIKTPVPEEVPARGDQTREKLYAPRAAKASARRPAAGLDPDYAWVARKSE